MSERSSAQANTPTSANMQYGYPSNHFDLINMQPIQNPNEVYSYYHPNLYGAFGTFDDPNQWGSADPSNNVPPGSIPFHPQLYTPSPHDIPRSPFDYPPPPHSYSNYHPGFTPSTFPGPPSTGTSGFDISWNPHSVSMQPIQVAPQQSMTPIGGGLTSNKKLSAYDEYPTGSVSDMLAQRLATVDLGGNPNNAEVHTYDNGTNDGTTMLPSKDQQHYQSTSNNLSLSSSRPSQIPSSSSSNGPKSYASVVSADTLNANSNKSTPSVSNINVRSSQQTLTNEHNYNSAGNFPNDSINPRSYTNMRGNTNHNNANNYNQQTRNGAGGYNSRNQQQQQQSSASGGVLNWTNANSTSNSRGNNHNASSVYYNSGSSNYYDRASHSNQQTFSSSNHSNTMNNKRTNSNYHQTYSSSRTSNNINNGNTSSNVSGQSQSASTGSHEALEALTRNHNYNPTEFNLNPKGARFFVIKSYSEDDVHRSIKYNIWCSTEHGNKRLDTAFREREGKGPIYLFFSVNASGHFCGMAEMMSPVDYEHKTNVWQMSNKWQGKFEVKWIYVKDVPNQQFRNIRLENNDNKPVTNSRDTQEIPYEKGKLMLKTMHLFRDKTSIFDDFQYYESKQAEETTKKPSQNDYNNSTPRGTYNNKRQYSSNRASTMQLDQQPQQQQHEDDNQTEEQ